MAIAEVIITGHTPDTTTPHPEGGAATMTTPEGEEPVTALALATVADGNTVTAIIREMLATAETLNHPDRAKRHLVAARALLYADNQRLPVNLFRTLNGPFSHLRGALLLLDGSYAAAASQFTAARNDYSLALPEFTTPTALAYLYLHSGLAAVLEARAIPTATNEQRELYNRGGKFFAQAAPQFEDEYRKDVAWALAAEAHYLGGDNYQCRLASNQAVLLLNPATAIGTARHMQHYCEWYLPHALALREHHNITVPPHSPLAHVEFVWTFDEFYVEQTAGPADA